MSEFISICPKCRHQILCDTEYVGKRVACPVCLQEITMPSAPQGAAPAAQPQTTAAQSAPAQAPAAGSGSQNTLIIAILIGAVVVVLAIGGMLYVLHNNTNSAQPAPQPVVTTPTPQPATKPPQPTVQPPSQATDTSDFETNHVTLETSSYIINITDIIQKSTKTSIDATYDGVSKSYGRRIVVKGVGTTAVSTDGSPPKYIGWTFANSNTIYFVSKEGELRVTQGTNVLVSEKGTWKDKPNKSQKRNPTFQ